MTTAGKLQMAREKAAQALENPSATISELADAARTHEVGIFALIYALAKPPKP